MKIFRGDRLKLNNVSIQWQDIVMIMSQEYLLRNLQSIVKKEENFDMRY